MNLMSHFWLSQVDTGATGMEQKKKKKISTVKYSTLHRASTTMKNCVAYIVNKESIEKNLLCRV